MSWADSAENVSIIAPGGQEKRRLQYYYYCMGAKLHERDDKGVSQSKSLVLLYNE